MPCYSLGLFAGKSTSGGPGAAVFALDTRRHWRYRPATRPMDSPFSPDRNFAVFLPSGFKAGMDR